MVARGLHIDIHTTEASRISIAARAECLRCAGSTWIWWHALAIYADLLRRANLIVALARARRGALALAVGVEELRGLAAGDARTVAQHLAPGALALTRTGVDVAAT